jgi:serine protease
MKRSALWMIALLAITALIGGSTLHVLGAPPEQARVFIQFQPGKATEVRASLERSGADFHYEFAELNTFVVTLPQAALNGFTNNPNVILVEEDAPRYLDNQTVPDGIDLVQARDVWDSDRNGVVDSGAPTGAGRLVCIIDSGLYTAHEDFAGVNIDGGYPSGWNTDGCGHGTHVAGTIAAANNALGVVGVTPGTTSLYIVKVFGDSCGWSYSSNLVDAANRCDAAGANIINMSLGGSTKVRTEETAFQNLYNKGILSIAAAGNDGTTRLNYPASYSSVVSVAAIDSNKVVADFSQKNSSVELAAPGVGVLSTVPWLADTSVTVDGVTYSANHIDFAKYDTASAALVNGGLCSAADSAFSGKVVLCERGDISFYDKVRNVQLSNGAAAIIYNNVPGGFLGTLGDGNTSTIPAVSMSQEDGQYLLANKLGKTATVTSNITKPGSGYEAWDGTSMATPHVSGAAALVWSANSSWTNAQIRDAFQKTALDLGAAGKDNAYGWGLVQAKSALTFLGGSPPPPPPPTGTLAVTVSTDKASYVNRNTVYITTLVTDGSAAVEGASVSLEVTTANGKKSTGSGTTGADGKITFTYKVDSKTGGVGTYTAASTASKSGYTSGSGLTTFTVTR